MSGSGPELLLPGKQPPVGQLHPVVQWSSSVQDNSSPESELPVPDPPGQSRGLQVRGDHLLHQGDGPHGCGLHCSGWIQCLLSHSSDSSHLGHLLLSWIKVPVNTWLSTVPGARRTNWRVRGGRQGVDQEGEETERKTEPISEKPNRTIHWVQYVRNVILQYKTQTWCGWKCSVF